MASQKQQTCALRWLSSLISDLQGSSSGEAELGAGFQVPDSTHKCISYLNETDLKCRHFFLPQQHRLMHSCQCETILYKLPLESCWAQSFIFVQIALVSFLPPPCPHSSFPDTSLTRELCTFNRNLGSSPAHITMKRFLKDRQNSNYCGKKNLEQSCTARHNINTVIFIF